MDGGRLERIEFGRRSSTTSLALAWAGKGREGVTARSLRWAVCGFWVKSRRRRQRGDSGAGKSGSDWISWAPRMGLQVGREDDAVVLAGSTVQGLDAEEDLEGWNRVTAGWVFQKACWLFWRD